MKSLKRIVSVTLVLLLLLGSMSVLGSATFNDGKGTTVSFDTKFYRYNGTEWVRTTKAARGEEIKIRVNINSDFVMSTATFFWLFNKHNIKFDASKHEPTGTDYKGVTNVIAQGIFFSTETGPIADLMMEYGYLPADTYDNYGYLFYKQESGLATKFNTKDWSLEFSYIVADDAEGSAQFFAPEKCFTDPDDDYSWDNPIIIGKVSDEREGQNIAGNYPEFQDSVDWKIQPELYDQDEDSTLTFTNPVKFNAGEGTFANGASEFTTGEGFIGEALSAADQPAAVTAPGGKSFVGWVPSTVDLATATAADCVDVSAIKYNYAVDTYNALYETTAATTFNFTFNPNGGAFADASTEAKTVTVNEGEAVNAPVPTRVGYEFKGWALSTVENPTVDDVQALPEAASADMSYKAVWSKNSYNVKWIVDGVTVKEESVAYGDELPAAPSVDAKAGYNFAWSSAPATMPAADVEITGAYTPIVYTVTWKIDGEQGTYKQTQATFGEAIATPEAPIEKEGYTFEWRGIPETMPADENLVITGYYVANSYKVTWTVDGKEFTTTTVKYGDAIIAPDYTAEAGYDFAWDEIPATMPANDITINGTTTAKTYTVTWNVNGEKVGETTVKFGDAIADYAFDTPEGYEFSGWTDKPATMPASDITVNGTTTAKSYTVTWNVNGEKVGETTVKFGDAIADYEYAAPAGCNFSGWTDKPETMPASNITVNGTTVANTYKVTWNVNGAKVGETEVKYGEAIADFEYTAPEGYTFSGWTDKPETMPASNITVNGTTVANTYKVTWNVNGAKVGETEVKYGEAIADFEYTAPAGYTFGGWTDKADTMPANDIVVNGTTVANGYNVVWKVNGEKVGETVVSYGDAIADYDYTAPEGYEFSGWTDKPETMPANEIVVNGTTTPKTYTVTWKVGDDFTTTTEVKYGEALAAPAYTPAAGYDFEWVDVPATMPANDALVISGKLTAKTYTVTWKVNGEIVGTTTETFGEAIADYAYTAPTGYTFSGWTDKPDTMPADDALVINGTNIANKYTVKFVDADGAEISSGEFEFGSDITAPSITVPDGMTLVGWVDGDGEAFTGKVPAKNVTYKPNIVSNDNVPYAIEIYLENVDGVYELSGSTSLTGTTGQSVSAVAGEVSGFTFNAAESTLTAIIAGDGSTKLVLKYSRNVYTATFDGVEYTVRYGAALPDVTPADKTGMEFVGWVDAQGNKAPATMPANDLALTSKWEAIEYTITYIVNGQKTVETYKYGDTVIAPADPVVDKMTFTGWSMEIPTTMPAENLIIIASFESTGTVDAYTVTFWADGVEFQKTLVKVGSEITLPTNSPTKEFYVFKGWKDVPAAMPANDIDIYAEFERVPVTLIPKAGSTTVIDRDNMVIYGLQERMSEATYNTYLDVEGDGHFTVTATANGFGTGTVIELYDNVTGQLLETYYVVIFGDLNGDSRVNATDVSLANDEVLSVTGWSLKQVYSNGVLVDNPDYKVYMTMAADLNGDGRIDSIDTSIISNRALALTYIDQVTGRATEA